MEQEPETKFSFKTTWVIVAIAVVLIAVSTVFIISEKFGALEKEADITTYAIPLKDVNLYLSADLKEKGFIKSERVFNIVFGNAEIKPGGYQISKSMNIFEIAKVFKVDPELKWVVIPEGLRKEQIAGILSDALGWDDETKIKWITSYSAMKYDEIEGLYFPDTYLIPKDDDPLKVANRLRSKFNDKFAPLSQEALEQNIKWTTVINLASIVQREAAGKDDMPLIAGILWNRLFQDMKLEVDATVQYARDDVIHYGKARYDKQPAGYSDDGTWWTPITPDDKNIESLYNTYRNKGLPPHPIANPGIEAINAVLYPAETECLYYLHDQSRVVHCAKTFGEHQANIEKYLQ